jgi:ATP-binding cassette subfamily F protein 3
MSVVIQIENLTKSYGPHEILRDASLTVSMGQKIGFIGRNGAGKSTLLRMITGEKKPDSGRILLHPITRLGYLEQHEVIPPDETVLAYLERKSQQPSWVCAKAVGAFDIKKERLHVPLLSLSGGYQMRVKLAAMFAREPNLLLLDEPTNYLDLQTTLLLERALHAYRGAFILISHDREFLKQVCTYTLELERGELFLFPQGIETYLAYKDEVVASRIRENKKIEEEREHLQTFIDRFRAKASKATQAQSKMKQLAKLKTIEIAHPLRAIRIHIPQVDTKKSFAIRATHLAIGYPGNIVAREINFEIQRGDHVAVLGENGQGKTTLLKTLADHLSPQQGTFTFGNKLRIAFYAQHINEMLHPKDAVGTYLARQAADGITQEDIYKMAGDFLFSEDDLEKSVAILSGGERARLCLAGILLGRYDVLLLDEPTSHLDVETVEALAGALNAFRGTVIFTSHSRTFVKLLATKILNVENGSVIPYPGTYEEYVYALRVALHTLPEEESDTSEETPGKRTKADIYRDIREQRRAVQKLDKTLEDHSNEKNRVLEDFAAHPTEFSLERNQKLHTLETVLRHTEDEWIAAKMRLEDLEREQMKES